MWYNFANHLKSGDYVNLANVNKYFNSVKEAFAGENIESSYNPAIVALFESFGAKARDMSGGRGQDKGGNIDIKLWRSDEEPSETSPFAGIEVKRVGGIDARAREQAKTSAGLLGNVILTDNCSWRFYRAGDEKPYTGVELIVREGGSLILKKENVEHFLNLVQDFLLQDPALIKSSGKLAEYMAIHAKFIRTIVVGILKEDGKGQPLVNDSQMNAPLFAEMLPLYGRGGIKLVPPKNHHHH